MLAEELVLELACRQSAGFSYSSRGGMNIKAVLELAHR